LTGSSIKDQIVSAKRVYLLIVASIATLFVLAACSEEVIPTQEPVDFSPTAAAEAEKTEITEPTTAADPVEEAPAVSAGDASEGQRLFISCGGCHSTDDSQIVGPGLGGVHARAGSRTSLDAEAYIEQSVREPGTFIVDGFPAVMPSFDHFSHEDMSNLIAYLKSLE
jgi:mono/diheme cytochrome c family protein